MTMAEETEHKGSAQHLRIARGTRQLDVIARFYQDALGFAVIAQFDAHRGFDGVMLALPDSSWHLEFTFEHTAEAAPSQTDQPSDEHLIVLYYEASDYVTAVDRAITHGARTVRSHNPYWDEHGTTIEDPDGNRIVLHRGIWGLAP